MSAGPQTVDGTYRFELFSPALRFWNRVLTRVVLAVFPPILRIFLGLRVEGRSHLDALFTGAVSICNHVHPLDCVILACAARRPISYLSLKSNFDYPVIGHIIRALRAVPVPDTPSGYLALRRYIARFVREEKGLFQVYPEGWLIPWCSELREFHRGSFQFAYDAGVPVLVFVLCQTPYTGLARLWHRRPALTLRILEPLFFDPTLCRREAVAALEAEARRRMENALRQGGSALAPAQDVPGPEPLQAP